MISLLNLPTDIMNYSDSSSSISPVEYVSVALRAFCFFLGISGNIMVVVFLVRHFKRKNFTVHLMLNLAAADILCLATLPFWTFDLLFSWTLGIPLCKFVCFVAYATIHASVLTITLMSVHRYVVVRNHHQWSRLGEWGERGLLVGVWVLSCIITIPPAITYRLGVVSGKLHCEQIVSSENEKFVILLLEIVLIYLLPLIVLLTSYFCLHQHIRNSGTSRIRSRSRYKLGPLVTCIVVTFVIFFTPYVIVNVMTIVQPLQPGSSGKEFAYKHIRAVVQGMIFMNSCVDPLLYAFNIRTLRQHALRRMTVRANRTGAQSQPQVSTVDGGAGQVPST